MRTFGIAVACVVSLALVAFVGCGQKASQNQPIEQVQAEAAKLSIDDLKAKVESCKAELTKYQAQLKDVQAKVAALKPADLISDAGKKLTAETSDVTAAINNIKQQLQVYIDELKKKGVDVTNLMTY